MINTLDKHFNFLDLVEKADINFISSQSFGKGDIVYNEGDAPKGLYLITSGHIGLMRLSANGSETLLRVFGPGSIFGHRSLITREKYHANSMALTDVKVQFIPKDIFEKNIDRCPRLLLHIAQKLAEELKIAENKFTGLASSNVTSRIIQTLAFLKSRYPSYRFTRKEIGEYCGAKTETVSRTLSKLEDEGLIKRSGRDLIIPEIEKLYSYASDIEND